MIYVQKKVPLLQLGKKWFVFDRSLLKRTIAYGWASAMQQATVQLGKLGVQAIVNTMGVAVSAAFTAVNRIDDVYSSGYYEWIAGIFPGNRGFEDYID